MVDYRLCNEMHAGVESGGMILKLFDSLTFLNHMKAVEISQYSDETVKSEQLFPKIIL